MNVVDVLALLIQATSHINTLATIIQRARTEGRDQLTAEEIAQVRAAAIASEGRLEAATA
jgi:hypothetical protein